MQNEADSALELTKPSEQGARHSPDAFWPPVEQPDWLEDLYLGLDGGDILPATPALPTGKLLDLTKTAHKVGRKHEELSDERQNVLLLRSEAMYEWDSSHFKIAHVKESRQGLVTELKALADKISTTTDVSNLKRLQDQLDSDSKAFDHQIEKLASLEKRLTKSQERMLQKEDSFMKSTERMIESVNGLGLPPSDDTEYSSDTEASSTQSGPSELNAERRIHPAIAVYYDKIAEVKIMRERLAHLLADFRKDKAKRAIQEDQDQALVPNNDDFRASFKVEYDQAVYDVTCAEEAAEAARSACVTSGVDAQIDPALVNDGLYTYSSELKADDVHSTTPSSLNLGPPEQAPPELERNISSSRLTMVTDFQGGSLSIGKPRLQQLSTAAIQNWMAGVEPMSETEQPVMDQPLPDIAGTTPLPEPPPKLLLEDSALDDAEWENIASGPLSPPQTSIPTISPMSRSTRSSSESRRFDLEPPSSLHLAVERLRLL